MDNIKFYLQQYIHSLQSVGKYDFTYDDVSKKFEKSDNTLRASLNRLIQKKQIYNVRKGFYVVIPPEYANMGMLPVEYFIDSLMRYLKRDYYVGLLSAAMFHGAAHQQPQVFNVIIKTPALRPVKKGKANILFSKRNSFPVNGIQQKKTETGYFNISSPELTFLDLIYFEHYVGGLNKIATILTELTEDINVTDFRNVLMNEFPNPVLQRAGYIAEYVLKSDKIALAIERMLEKRITRNVLLKSSGNKAGMTDNKWKVIVNTEIEKDL